LKGKMVRGTWSVMGLFLRQGRRKDRGNLKGDKGGEIDRGRRKVPIDCTPNLKAKGRLNWPRRGELKKNTERRGAKKVKKKKICERSKKQ